MNRDLIQSALLVVWGPILLFSLAFIVSWVIRIYFYYFEVLAHFFGFKKVVTE